MISVSFFFVVEYSFLQHCTYNQPNTETAKHQTHNKKKLQQDPILAG